MPRMSDRAMDRKYMRDMARRDRQMQDMARRDRQMRDMARGGRGRDRAMDYAMDGRNPYGRKGGYTDRRDRQMNDMNSGRDYGYDSADYDMGYRYADNAGQDYGMDYMDYQQDMRYDRHRMPFEMRGSFGMRDYRPGNPMGYMADYDYASSEKLSEEDLKEWYDELCEGIPQQYKQLYKKEHIEQVAKQMNIEFKEFKPMELVVTTVMIASDYPKSIGYADVNRNVAMAKEWLEDKDSNLKGGEKLSAYYDNVVKG